MRKAIQHTLAAAQSSDRLPVVFLVQKETCFLPVFEVDQITNPVFNNFCLRALRSGQILQRKEPLISVSYTHLDVYKRQDTDRDAAPDLAAKYL